RSGRRSQILGQSGQGQQGIVAGADRFIRGEGVGEGGEGRSRQQNQKGCRRPPRKRGDDQHRRQPRGGKDERGHKQGNPARRAVRPATDPPRQERFPPPSRALKDSGPGGGGQGEAHKRHRFAEAENEGAQRGGENPLKDQGHPKNAEQYGKGPSPPERMAGRFFFIGFGLPSGNRFGRERKEQE